MFFFREINPLSFSLLQRIYRQSAHHKVRQRAHFLILASQHVKINKLMEIFNISHRTIFNWLNRWEYDGMIGLYDRSGRGRKKTFNPEQEAEIRDWTREEPRQLKKVLQKVKEKWKVETSTKTIKRILNSLSMSWHRMRRSVRGKPDPIEYAEKRAKLEEFKRLEDAGEINLYYLDETGFCLIPNVPYGWQNIGEYLPIDSSRSKRLNVLGIMSRKNHLEAYVSNESINYDVIAEFVRAGSPLMERTQAAACIDAFFPIVFIPTVIVVDKASIHTSGAILDRYEEWKERGITIFELPAYSPELNLRMQPRGGFLRMCCTKQLKFYGDSLNMNGLK
jgi:transposase